MAVSLHRGTVRCYSILSMTIWEHYLEVAGQEANSQGYQITLDNQGAGHKSSRRPVARVQQYIICNSESVLTQLHLQPCMHKSHSRQMSSLAKPHLYTAKDKGSAFLQPFWIYACALVCLPCFACLGSGLSSFELMTSGCKLQVARSAFDCYVRRTTLKDNAIAQCRGITATLCKSDTG